MNVELECQERHRHRRVYDIMLALLEGRLIVCHSFEGPKGPHRGQFADPTSHKEKKKKRREKEGGGEKREERVLISHFSKHIMIMPKHAFRISLTYIMHVQHTDWHGPGSTKVESPSKLTNNILDNYLERDVS